MHAALVDATVSHTLLHRTHGIPEVIHAKLLESSTGKRAGVIDAIKKGINLDGGLCGCRKSTLGSFALSSEATECTVVACKVFSAILALEVLHAEVHNAVVKILATKMGVAGSGLHLEDAILDCEERHVESAATHVVNQHIALAT